MRNLKRALALALSSVMLMGMMVVGTSAASYPDVTDAHDAEAIEVMQAIGVMVGDDQGNFNPDQNVTRAEAAVVIAKLLDLGVEDFKGADLTFTDVPEWAVPFVAAVQAEGIIAGYNETTFGSNDTVTAAQYALMVMKTLGYFQFESDYGTNWEMATAKQAGQIDLYDGIESGVKTPLNRAEVARVTLNALESAKVWADGAGLTVESGDVKVTSTHTYEKYGSSSNAIGDKGYWELGEDLFDNKLVKDTEARDALGRPAAQWLYKGEKIGTYAETADQIVVVDDTYASAKKVYVELVNDDFDKNVEDVYMNGVDTASYVPAIGDKVEYFLDDQGNIDTAAVIRYSIAQIDEVDTEVSKKDKADDVTCYVDMDLAGIDYLADTKIAGFDAETYVEDAYVLYVLNADGDKIIASEIAESLTGKVDGVKKNGDVKIDGEYYTNLSKTTLTIGDEIVAYVDLAGQILVIDDKTNESDDYAYIRHVYKDTSKDGLKTETYTAYAILADGTTASYEVKDAVKKGIVEGFTGVVAYSINGDGEMVIEAAADPIKKVTTSAVIDKDAADIEGFNGNSETEFVFYWLSDSNKVKTDVATGYKNVNIAKGTTAYVVYDVDNDDALTVFVLDENGTVSSDKLLAVLADDAYSQYEDADGSKYYVYDVIIGTEETTLKTEDTELLAGLADGTPFQYTLDEKGFINDDKTFAVLPSGVISVINDDYMRVNGTMYNLGGDEELATIVIELNKAQDKVIDLTVKAGASLDKDDTVYVAYDAEAEELVAVYLVKVIK